MMLMALLTVAALAFLVFKFGPGFLKKLLGDQVAVDVGVTVMFMWLFATTGAVSGVMTGIVAGLIVSVLLWLASLIFPAERLTAKGWKAKKSWLSSKLEEWNL